MNFISWMILTFLACPERSGASHAGDMQFSRSFPGEMAEALSGYEEPFIRREFIFPPNPAQYPHVHASSLVELPNGDLLAAWYSGGTDKSPDVCIMSARLPHGDTLWTTPAVLADTPEKSDNNPVLFVDGKQQLWLFYATLMGKPWESAIVKYRKATDYGRGVVWGPEQMLEVTVSPFILGLITKEGWMTRNHPLLLDDGQILLPLYSDRIDCSLMAISTDSGQNWSFSQLIQSWQENIQPTVVQLTDGNLLTYMRDGSSRSRVWKSTSVDGGHTWGSPVQIDLPNPGSALEMIRLTSGALLLAFNDSEKDRSVLTLALSNDEGKTWPAKRNLESEPGGRFDYPSVIQTQDGRIHLTYSYNVKSIKHVVLNEAWIRGTQ